MAVQTRDIRHTPASSKSRAASAAHGDRNAPRVVSVLGMREKLVVSGSRDARVAAIAAHQRGRVSRRQLLAAGLSEGQVDQMVRRDRMFRLHAGVYAVGHPAPVPRGPETAALLAIAGGGSLSHTSAAALWGLLDADPADVVHVAVGERWNVRRLGICAHRSRLLSPADCRVRSGLPVCSPAWTLLELAGVLDERRLIRAFDRGQAAGVVRPSDLRELLARVGAHRDRRRLRVLLEDRPGFTRSEAEQQLLALIRDADLPLPRVNQRLHGFEVDLHWPQAAFVVEVDGFAFHSSRAAFDRDRARDARLQAARIEVMRVTWRQLEHEPLAVVARIAQALVRRCQASGGDR
jgi:very-short-patch-repair endonuclease